MRRVALALPFGIAIITMVVAGPARAAVQLLEFGRETLRGIDAVGVVVEILHEDVEVAGLTTSPIQTDAEDRLRQSGIRVLSKSDRAAAPGRPHVYVSIDLDPDSYAYLVRVEFRQDVESFVRRGSTIPGVPTWVSGSRGVVGQTVPDGVRDTVRDDIDRFIGDFLAVNPNMP